LKRASLFLIFTEVKVSKIGREGQERGKGKEGLGKGGERRGG